MLVLPQLYVVNNESAFINATISIGESPTDYFRQVRHPSNQNRVPTPTETAGYVAT